jgi:hypothetical protein
VCYYHHNLTWTVVRLVWSSNRSQY